VDVLEVRMLATSSLRPGLSIGSFALAALIGLGVPLGAQAATETLDKTAPIPAGGTLKVRNFSGKVEITGTDRSDVSLHAVRRAPQDRLDRIKLDVQTDGDTVTIEANKRTGPKQDNDNVVETDMTIEVPRQVKLDIDVFSSEVTVRGVAGGNNHVKTFSGEITLEGVTGRVDAETFSGAIHASPVKWAASDTLRFHTFSGDIGVRVPAEANAAVEFESFSGGLQSDVPLTFRNKSKHNLKAELNSADGPNSARLTLQTFSGDVRITK
jgi:DUF4097 and DUF4098 domain-containing protein YvlB